MHLFVKLWAYGVKRRNNGFQKQGENKKQKTGNPEDTSATKN